MRDLSDYVQKEQTALFSKHGAFFAFSQKQFDEAQQDGVNYTNMGYGLICPRDNAKMLFKELDDLNTKGIKQDLADNGKENIIERELCNHECYFTMDIDDCVNKLVDYPIDVEEIQSVFNKNLNQHSND